MSPYNSRDNPSLPASVGLVLHFVSEQTEAQSHLNDIWNEVFLIGTKIIVCWGTLYGLIFILRAGAINTIIDELSDSANYTLFFNICLQN